MQSGQIPNQASMYTLGNIVLILSPEVMAAGGLTQEQLQQIQVHYTKRVFIKSTFTTIIILITTLVFLVDGFQNSLQTTFLDIIVYKMSLFSRKAKQMLWMALVLI